MHFPSNQNNFTIAQQTYGVNQISNFKKAVANNHKEAIEKHLSHIKLQQAQLNDALMLSLANYKVQENSNDCLFLLLRHKSNPNCQINKTTPLIAAIKKGQQQAVKTLIEFGAKPDQCNSLGQHPLEIAFNLKGQHSTLIECLINNMASSLNIEINKKQILFVAVQKQYDKVFKILIEKGVDLIYDDHSILHSIMKKKFKSQPKKKRMITFLASVSNLNKINLVFKDSQGKLPQQYETEECIKAHFQEKFKPKIKEKQVIVSKESHKMKDSGIQNNDSFVSNVSGKQKQSKKKHSFLNIKDQDVSFQEIQDQEQNLDRVSSTIDEDIQILQAGQQEQQQKKTQQEKNKKGKLSFSVQNLNSTVQKKTPKQLTKISIDPNVKVKKNIKKNSKTISSNNSSNEVKKKTLSVSTTGNKKKINDQKKNEDENSNNSNLSKKYERKSSKNESALKPSQKNKEKKENLQKSMFSQDQSPSAKLSLKNKIFQQKSQQTQTIKIQKIDSSQSIDISSSILKQEKSINIQNKTPQKLQFSLKQDKIQEGFDSLSSSQQSQQQDNRTLAQMLNQQILNTINDINLATNQTREFIQKIITYFQQKIRYIINLDNFREQPASVQIFLYGSYANNLAVKHSDIDLLATTSMNASDLIKKLQKCKAFDEQHISEVKFITNTTMPVVKMNYGSYKVDLTFQIRGHTGIRCSQLIRQFLIAQPLLRPLVLILKTMLNSYDLCDTYTGGLGSYSLTLMTIALLQSTECLKSEENLGVLFLQFLLFYGFQMDYVCQAIIIHPPGFTEKPVYSIYQLPNTLDLTPKLIIYDPLNPVNNVGRATYRILALKKLFIVWYNRLQLNQCKLTDLMDGGFKQLFYDYT